MEVIKTRRDGLTQSSGTRFVRMPYPLLQTVVSDIVTGKAVSSTGVMTLSRQNALPTSSMTYGTETYWPTRIPASQCGSTVYIWYWDENTIRYFTDASSVTGMNTVQLN